MENPNRGKTKFKVTDFQEFEDENDIDDVLKKELADAGLAYRFIDFKQAKLNGGRSRAGWIVYRRQSPDPRMAGVKALEDPDGLVRQGSMVLAVKPLAAAAKQKARIAAQNRLLSDYNKTAAEDLTNDARKIGSRVVRGYEQNS